MSYTVKLPVFEGPFDLLLHLVKANEMDLQDIQVAEITKQYLDYIDVMRELDLELAGEFLVMAATLIHLKARTLLPVPPDETEQEEEINEIMSAKELVRQLIEYRKYKEAAVCLRGREASASRVLFRNNVLSVVAEPAEQMSADLTLLYKAFARVLRYVDSPAFRPQITEQYTVEEKLLHIEELLQREGKVDLDDVFRRCFNRAEVIVTFLAIVTSAAATLKFQYWRLIREA